MGKIIKQLSFVFFIEMRYFKNMLNKNYFIDTKVGVVMLMYTIQATQRRLVSETGLCTKILF